MDIKKVVPKWGKCRSGSFIPSNKNKYNGRYPIIYRSSLEYQFMRICDESDSIINWSSETYTINYLSPKDYKQHRYYPDFLLKVVDKNNNIETIIVEIKPFKQTIKPKLPKNKTAKSLLKYQKDLIEWEVNLAKWEAAVALCNKLNFKFNIITEKWLNSIKK